uniref:Alpha-macroglobulin receptor-binding domain-containing protein n=1 Tax=Podarcis muralis TaxID=64176 RepID=A0A670K9P6_PODMU
DCYIQRKQAKGNNPTTNCILLRDDRIVMKVESKENHVIIYLDYVCSGISFSFLVAQDLPVSNIKPASVFVYDYYETGKEN